MRSKREMALVIEEFPFLEGKLHMTTNFKVSRLDLNDLHETSEFTENGGGYFEDKIVYAVTVSNKLEKFEIPLIDFLHEKPEMRILKGFVFEKERGGCSECYHSITFKKMPKKSIKELLNEFDREFKAKLLLA